MKFNEYIEHIKSLEADAEIPEPAIVEEQRVAFLFRLNSIDGQELSTKEKVLDKLKRSWGIEEIPGSVDPEFSNDVEFKLKVEEEEDVQEQQNQEKEEKTGGEEKKAEEEAKKRQEEEEEKNRQEEEEEKNRQEEEAKKRQEEEEEKNRQEEEEAKKRQEEESQMRNQGPDSSASNQERGDLAAAQKAAENATKADKAYRNWAAWLKVSIPFFVLGALPAFGAGAVLVSMAVLGKVSVLGLTLAWGLMLGPVPVAALVGAACLAIGLAILIAAAVNWHRVRTLDLSQDNHAHVDIADNGRITVKQREEDVLFNKINLDKDPGEYRSANIEEFSFWERSFLKHLDRRQKKTRLGLAVAVISLSVLIAAAAIALPLLAFFTPLTLGLSATAIIAISASVAPAALIIAGVVYGTTVYKVGTQGVETDFIHNPYAVDSESALIKSKHNPSSQAIPGQHSGSGQEMDEKNTEGGGSDTVPLLDNDDNSSQPPAINPKAIKVFGGKHADYEGAALIADRMCWVKGSFSNAASEDLRRLQICIPGQQSSRQR